MGKLQLKNISIGYGDQRVISDLNLLVKNGELLSLLGPSGVGKTTLLKTIAGLSYPQKGTIRIDDKDITHMPADRRDTVLLFQKPLLFPFLTVVENIGFGLRMKKLESKQVAARCKTVMDLTEITDLGKKKTDQLSGGQQQRVALARALILEPSILLLDEPFSSLDFDLRRKMQNLIRRLQQQTTTTMLFVTHDQGEAFSISDRIALLFDGKVVQIDTPENLFIFPSTPEIAHFFGSHNIISGHISDGILFSQELKIPVTSRDTKTCTAIIRPEHISLSRTQTPRSIGGTVVGKHFEGALTRVTVQLKSRTLTVLSLSSDFFPEQEVWVHFPPEKVHIFM